MPELTRPDCLPEIDPVLPAPLVHPALWHTATHPRHSMIYETVARTLFIRANGIDAYYRATGIVPDMPTTPVAEG